MPDTDLPLSAEQTARATGMLPLFDRIRELSSESSSENRWELFFQRQQALMEVTSASLEVDAATGQMDVEIAETRELQNYLTTHRDSQVGRLNLVSIAIGGTAGTASSALGLTTHARAASVTGIVAGSATAVLSLIGLRISEGPKRELEVKSNMLSELFDRPANDRNVYSKVVATFMNSPVPGDPDGLTRQQRLIRGWVQVGRIPEPESAKGHEKIVQITSMPGEKIKQTIGDLDDRQAMLYDFRARLTHMKRDLAILLGSIPSEMPMNPLPGPKP
ncbi:hypothetical protein [Tunturiibacter gelidiferens]|uniref:Uncharacterized protein n=1 Tax=Tunturiibacter gelidiferens TaxID=3069689 RepID=A0AAU7Z0T2_9BACT